MSNNIEYKKQLSNAIYNAVYNASKLQLSHVNFHQKLSC